MGNSQGEDECGKRTGLLGIRVIFWKVGIMEKGFFSMMNTCMKANISIIKGTGRDD